MDFLNASIGERDKTYWQRLNGPLGFLIGPGTFLGFAKQRAGNLFAPLVVIYVIYQIAALSGRSNANRQAEFLVPSSNSAAVVVKKYGDKIICSEIDLDKKQRLYRFFIINEGADPALVFNWKKIGKLKKAED